MSPKPKIKTYSFNEVFPKKNPAFKKAYKKEMDELYERYVEEWMNDQTKWRKRFQELLTKVRKTF